MAEKYRMQDRDLVFALDIGTRSIIGIVGKVEEERLRVLAIEKEEHGKRAMLDGQIEDIAQVAKVAATVTKRLEEKLGVHLSRVCIAAAGRALHTECGTFELTFSEGRRIDDDLIGQLEAGAVSQAEAALNQETEGGSQFFLVGYTVRQYMLDNYPMSTLRDHNGKQIQAEVVATFLPGEVVESLYSTMQMAGLEVASLTLEPIAALNAAIPADIRLLNLVLVDIGAGTSDIAACRDGSVVGYTMATLAGDEITEAIMKALLVDFGTAERLKAGLSTGEAQHYQDILGMEEQITTEALQELIAPSVQVLAEELARCVVELNSGAPSALFLAGGGSKLAGLQELMAKILGMDTKRVAVAGNNYKISAFSNDYDLNDPEYATPLGIAVSTGLGLINDSYRVMLNGQPAKLFRSGTLTALDVLMMNGYAYADLIGRTGRTLSVAIDGKRTFYRGEPATPSVLQVNGQEAPPSTVVHTGDSISFTPARAGTDAEVMLADVVGGPEHIATTMLNGALAEGNRRLQSGDEIVTRVKLPPVRTEVPVPSVQPVQTVPQAEPMAEPQAEPVAPQPPVQVSAPAAEEQPGQTPPQAEETAAPEAVPVMAQPQLPPRRFFLNGKPLELPAKADGGSYYLMDMLEYSDIDFEHLDRRVILEINGQEGAFTQELRDGDAVGIRYEEPI